MEKANGIRFTDLGPVAQEALVRLTPEYRAFIKAYFENNYNGSAAVRAAYGPTARSVGRRASEILDIEDVKTVVEELRLAAASKFEVTDNKVLQAYAKLAFADARDFFNADGSLIHIKDLPRELADMVAGFEHDDITVGTGESRTTIGTTTKIRLINRKDALDSLAKTLGLFAEGKKKEKEEKAKVVRFPRSVTEADWQKTHKA